MVFLSADCQPMCATFAAEAKTRCGMNPTNTLLSRKDNFDGVHEIDRFAQHNRVAGLHLLATIRQQEGTVGIAQRHGSGGGFGYFQKGEHFVVVRRSALGIPCVKTLVNPS